MAQEKKAHINMQSIATILRHHREVGQDGYSVQQLANTDEILVSFVKRPPKAYRLFHVPKKIHFLNHARAHGLIVNLSEEPQVEWAVSAVGSA